MLSGLHLPPIHKLIDRIFFSFARKWIKFKENSAASNVKIKNAVRPLKPSTVCLVKKIEVNKKWQEKRSDYLVIYHCGAHQMSVLSESVCVWFFAAIAMLVETFTFSKCIPSCLDLNVYFWLNSSFFVHLLFLDSFPRALATRKNHTERPTSLKHQ